MRRWATRGVGPLAVSTVVDALNSPMEIVDEGSATADSLCDSSASDAEISTNESDSEDLSLGDQFDAVPAINEDNEQDLSSSDDASFSFGEELNSSVSDEDETQNNEANNKIDEGAVRIDRDFHKVRLYPQSEATLDETVLDLVRMYVERGCTKSLLSYTLNMILKTMPKNHSFPTSIYKLFKYVKNVAPRFTSTEHFYCNNIHCMQYIGKKKSQCDSCLDNAELESFYEIDISEQVTHMFRYRGLADKLNVPTSIKKTSISDITDGSEYIRVNSRDGRRPFDLTLILNTDGISLSKSSKSSCWPLMFTITELPEYLRESFMIVAGIWCSKKCNPVMNTFLMPFCIKLHEYYHKGISWIHPRTNEMCKTKIVVPLIVADAPARAKIQNILNFNGRYGCNTCEIKMKKCLGDEQARVTRSYPFLENIRLRNGKRMEIQAEKVSQNTKIKNIKGVKGKTIISSLPFLDLGTCLPPEYMHSTLLGVGLQCMTFFFDSSGPWSIRKSAREIDNQFLKIRPPHFFSRMPRRILENLKSFKASEIYNWILFYSCPLMQNFQCEKYFQHWLLFVESLFTLLQRSITENELKKTEILLKLFVRDFCKLYGERSATYNVHQLLHLVVCVRRWGPLWAWSAFSFESFNGQLTKLTHGTKHIGQELLHKLQLVRGLQILKHQIDERSSMASNNPIIQQLDNNNVKGIHRLNIKLNDIERNILVSKGLLDLRHCKFYQRGIVHGEEYTSLSYKDTMYNSFTVCIKRQDNSSIYGMIRFYLLVEGDLCFVVQNLSVERAKFIIQNETQTKISHIIPVNELQEFTFINVKEVKQMYHVIRVLNYVVKRPNLFKKNM